MQQDSANTIYSEDCHDLRTLNFSLNKAELEDYLHFLVLRITTLKFKS